MIRMMAGLKLVRWEWVFVGVIIVAQQLPSSICFQVAEWKTAEADGLKRFKSLSVPFIKDANGMEKPAYPLLGSAYYCKSRSEYEKEAEDGISGYFFCKGYVDYAAACDATDETSCNNELAISLFHNFQRALNVYDCNTYSQLWTCGNCSDAYKRWLCSQVYKKMYLPDTKPTRTGTVGGGKSPPNFIIACPWPPPGETENEAKLEKAKVSPHFVKICSGMAKDPATGAVRSTESLALSPG
jgi:hypothetical protein